MASRLYPATRRLFWQVVSILRQLQIPSALTPTAFALVALYLCGLILLDRRQTPWRMQTWLPARSHDALNRLLRVGAFSTRALFAPVVGWAKRTGLPGYLCLDDVVVEKAFARQSHWMGWMYSFAAKRQVYGFQVVVLSWCAGPWRIPVAFRVWRPKAHCAPRRYRTKLELAQSMLDGVLALGLPIDYLVFDTHYTAGWLTKALTRRGLRWNGTLDPKTIVHYHHRRWTVRDLAAHLKLRWRPHLEVRAQAVTVYAPKYGRLRLVVTKNRHGNYEYIVSNHLGADLTTLVQRKHSRWSIETVFRDTKQFAGLAACQCRVDPALVRHIALVLLAFSVLQFLRRDPAETLGAVKERWQLCLVQANAPAPRPLKARAALL